MLCLRRQMGSPLTILKIKIKELKNLKLKRLFFDFLSS